MNALKNLDLTRFKCFASQRIPLAATTLLTGLNGMGKSSVIQALLLLRQSARAGLLQPPVAGGQAGLLLNGELVRLGTGAEVHYEGAAEDTLSIAIEAEGAALETWRFDARSGADLLPWLDGPATLPPFALFGSQCYYLGAERIGPRTVHTLSASQVQREVALSRLDTSLATWETGPFHPGMDFSVESSSTLDHGAYGPMRDFMCVDNRERRFSHHLKLFSNNWRIYYVETRVLQAGGRAYVGYVGAHLPTVKHPT